MSKQYLYNTHNTPDYIQEFYKRRRQEIKNRKLKIESQVKELPIVLAIGKETLDYTVGSVKLSGANGTYIINIPMSCAFPNSDILIYDMTKNVIYGKPSIHIFMQTRFIFGMLDTESVEIEIPKSKIDNNLMAVIKQLTQR